MTVEEADVWAGYESLLTRQKYNPSTEIANKVLCHNYKHWLDIKEPPLASTVHMWPERMSCACFLECPLIARSVGFILWEAQPANGNISFLFPRAMLAMLWKEKQAHPVSERDFQAAPISGRQKLQDQTHVLMVSG